MSDDDALARYALGVDLGTTYTAAAVLRDGRAEIVTFGHRSTSLPSVIYGGDDAVLVGEPADRRRTTEPERVAREFKRRMGDPTPTMLGGRPWSAELLTSELLQAVVAQVVADQGGAPASIVLTHPANWGPYKLEVLREDVRICGLDGVVMVAEPVAAATYYATEARVADGTAIAVYDLGGGTFDATVVRRDGDAFRVLGEPRGIERLGGIDFDEAVFAFVLDAAGIDLDALDPGDPTTMGALAQLRRDCVEAKEALSQYTVVNIGVLLPSAQRQVRITRTEFEHLVQPLVDRSVTTLARAIDEAGDGVRSVLLVGGSSRVPLVGRRIAEGLRLPVSIDAHPKHSVALGAAIVAARVAAPAPSPAVEPATAPEPHPEPESVAPATPPEPFVPPPSPAPPPP